LIIHSTLIKCNTNKYSLRVKRNSSKKLKVKTLNFRAILRTTSSQKGSEEKLTSFEVEKERPFLWQL
jgi:hypothetical protein